MLNNTLANALSLILNAERISKKEVMIKPVSKVIFKVLDIMQSNLFIGGVKVIESANGNYAIVNLLGNINKCNAIRPCHETSVQNFEKFEKRLMTAKYFGIMMITTSQGIMTHMEA